jgi:hypothetical protein
MEKFLDEVASFVKEASLELYNKSDDGRVNSIKNESEVIELLMNNEYFKKFIVPQKSRAFCDFDAVVDGEVAHVNIKVSSMKQADNCSSKAGMGYALTGEEHLPTDYTNFHKAIIVGLKPGFDYYFLVIDKNDLKGSYWTSLKRIKTLVPNGNNLPFQCRWDDNREWSDRTEIEAMKYILKVYLKSWDNRVSGYPAVMKDPEFESLFGGNF